MRNLQELYTSNNELTGSLPKCFFNLTSLEILDLSFNQFFGNIFALKSLISLESLDLSYNQFSGNISAFETLKSLQMLDLSSNQFSGDISALKTLKSLRKLKLSNNKFETPSSLGPLFNLSKLQYIYADNNIIYSETEYAPIPKEFCQPNLDDLMHLDLSVNNISGSIPSCFSPSWINQVHLSRNKLQGPLRNAFRNSNSLTTFDLSNNHLTEKIPNWIGRLSQLSYLVLNSNHFEGEIPVELCKLRQLSLIDLSNNNLSGTIPPCLKITTLNGTFQAIDPEGLIASFNDYPGTIEFTTKKHILLLQGKNSYFTVWN
ncbi:hypothetical protein DITRI_Ditri10aG0159100 [Diplodiscus trichospermus]